MLRVHPAAVAVPILVALSTTFWHGGGALECGGCEPKLAANVFEKIRAERDPGLAATVRDDAAGVEWGLLQLDRYSSLYGAKDFWVTWRSLKGGAPPPLSALVPGAAAPLPRFTVTPPSHEDAEREEHIEHLLRNGDGTWAPPVFTGVVYQFAPPAAKYLPTALLRFARDGATFTLALGVPEKIRASYPGVPLVERRFTLADLAADRDGDGLTDATESLFLTDPARADTDGDGVPDGSDREPLTPAGAGAATDERIVVADAFSHYNCIKPEPIIFAAPAGGPVPLKNEGCVNIMLPNERVEALAVPAAEGDVRSLDRAIELIRYKIKRDDATDFGTVLMVSVGDTMFLRHYLYKRRTGGGWELFKETVPVLAEATFTAPASAPASGPATGGATAAPTAPHAPLPAAPK